jgi:cysteinyl-tRNA synthetase
MVLKLYNTQTRTLLEFSPIIPGVVTMYNCGPTVYNYLQIGNLRSYLFADILRRALEMHGYAVHQIINITDVGHLVGDADDTEDKMALALKREGKPFTKEAMQSVGEFYTAQFKTDITALHILPAQLYPRASDHILEDVALIQTLTEKGFTYTTSDGVYFDTTKFPRYADFARLDILGMQAGKRIDVGEKKNASDFALWKYNDILGYDAPIGKGFPGWHIECSAMAMKYLGETIDIHTGGIDHIPVHHTNEIAQSESATGKPFAHYWLHNGHILMDGEKMSKSLGNTYRLIDLRERGIPPLAYRYWLLTAHYRTQVNFTWEAMAAAQSAYNKLTNIILGLSRHHDGTPHAHYADAFRTFIDDDLNTAGALGLLWKLVKEEEISDEDKYATIIEMDKVLGLGLTLMQENLTRHEIPSDVKALIEERVRARAQKDFVASDRIRDKIRALGFDVIDAPSGAELKKL